MLRSIAIAVACAALGAHAQQRPIAADALRSGVAFAGDDVRAMQADDLSNPGFLWVQRGEALFNENCTSCHRDASTMRSVAARYPVYDASSKSVVDLEARIDQCRTERQRKPAFGRESDELLALATFVTHQSRGMPISVSIDGPARDAFVRGEAFYRQRHGQMNLACTHCHDQNYGKRLYVETISQGHGTAFPAYRLEWPARGSLRFTRRPASARLWVKERRAANSTGACTSWSAR